MRIGLAAKLCFLAAGLVLAASAASFLFFENARAAARERELIDLADKTDDSGRMLLADIDRVQSDLLSLAAMPAVRRLYVPGQTPAPEDIQAVRQAAEKVLENRRSFQQIDFVRLDSSAGIVAQFSRQTPSAHLAMGPGQTVFKIAQKKSLGQCVIAKGDANQPANVIAATPIAATGSDSVAGMVLIRIDLLVWGERLNQSARVLGFLVNDEKKYLAHPVRVRLLETLKPSDSALDAMVAELSEKIHPPAESDHSDAVLRRDKLNLPELAYVLTTARISPPPSPKDLAGTMAVVEAIDPSLRISANGGPGQLLCRADKPETLRHALQQLQSRLAGSRVDWDEPIHCSTFGVTLKVLRPPADAAAAGQWYVLGLAVATEEVERAIQAAHRRNLWLTLALSGAAGLAALGFAHYLTRPLRQMIGYAQRVAAGQESEAPLEIPRGHGQDEIGTLARAFGSMVEQVRARTRELRESEARIRTILNTAAEGIITIDERGRLESFNLAAERLFGYAASEVRGEHFTKLLQRGAPSDMPTLLGFGSSARSSGNVSVESSLLSISRVNGTTREVMARNRTGANFPAEMSVSEVILGDRLVYTAILRDITERKQAEAANERMTVELERRVADRTAELIQANQALESARDLALEANRAKDAFLAVMSHELRTPLNAIIGYCDYWLQEADELDSDAMLDDLRKMQVSGKHLLTLINDILDLAKIQAGKISLDLGDFPLPQLLTELQEWVAPLIRKNDNTLIVDAATDLGVMHADRTRVRQILLNLLSNAAKFTTQGTIRLIVRRERGSSDEFVFQVEDTGVGMKPEDVRKLFRETFFQADSSSTRKHEGTGLGLVICHKLCKLMGGEIEVQSALGVGTTFTVRIPARVAPGLPVGKDRPAPAPSDTPTVNWQSPTVLVIDDDGASRAVLERVLRREGYAVRAAAGAQAVAAARECRPQAIVLDALAPGKNGWSALAALRSDPATADVPVIMATIVDDQSRGVALSSADFITKPIDWDRLGVILRPFRQQRPDAPVLVVDDDAAAREVTARRLAAQGWQVIEAGHGREALELLGTIRPAVILLDLMMPEMNGFEVVERLRTNADWRGIPVVVVTAVDLAPEDRRRLSGAVEEILQKGAYTAEQLVSAVRERLARRLLPR